MSESKSTRSATWFARVDGSREELETKAKTFAECKDVLEFIAAYHVGDKKENPHIHFCVKLNNEPQKGSFAVRIKKHFSIVDKNYALKVWDGNHGRGAVSYLYHEEGVTPFIFKGFTDEDLVSAREANASVQAVVAINKERASTKIPDRLYDEFKECSMENIQSLHHMMVSFVIVKCRNGEMYWPGEFMLKKYVEEACLRVMDESRIEVYTSNLVCRLWRD